MTRHPIAKLAPAALLLLALPGCISFGDKPPKSLLSLSSDAQIPTGNNNAARDVNAVSVAIPAAPGALNNQRIAVLSNNAFAYVPKAAWVDTPARLFRNVLAETIEAKTGRFVPDVRNAAITPDTRLGGTLAAFELLGGQGKVLVIYDATLAKSGSDTIQTRRFEATSAVSSEEPEAVSAALNRAANGGSDRCRGVGGESFLGTGRPDFPLNHPPTNAPGMLPVSATIAMRGVAKADVELPGTKRR